MVVVCWCFMSTGHPVLVSAGALPELTMRAASEELARVCAMPLLCHGIGESPQLVLSRAEGNEQLIRISGDPGRLHSEGSSWLEALADWHRPVLLLVGADPDGGVPGAAAAYTALCRQLGVSLIGLVQVQGRWNEAQRKRDGLPWVSWIAPEGHSEREQGLELLAERIRPFLLRMARAGGTVPA